MPEAVSSLMAKKPSGCSEPSSMSGVMDMARSRLTNPETNSILNTTRDTADNLDFAMLDDIAKKLAAWVIECGDEPLDSYAVYW